MTIEELAEDLYQFAALNAGWISYGRYVKYTSYEPDEAEGPDSPQEIIEAMVYLQEQGRGTFWRDASGEIDGVFVGEGHATRAKEHRDRALRAWLAQGDQVAEGPVTPW